VVSSRSPRAFQAAGTESRPRTGRENDAPRFEDAPADLHRVRPAQAGAPGDRPVAQSVGELSRFGDEAVAHPAHARQDRARVDAQSVAP
jgi:hypothetical protein